MKKGYLIRKSIAIIVGILSLLAVCGVFYPVKFMDIQFTPLLQRLIFDFSIIAAVLFGLVILATLLFGRFYCSTICPFGILQEFAGIIRGKKKNSLHKNYCPKNSRDKEREREFGVAYETAQPRVDLRERGKQAAEDCFIWFKYLIAGLTFGGLIGGSALLIRYVDPYTNFGSAISLSVFGIIFTLTVLAIVFFKNRFFCTNICPVGCALGIISKFSLNKIYMDENCVKCGICANNCPAGCINHKEKTVDNELCIKCLKCLSVCPKGAIKFGLQPVRFNPKRRDFLVAGGALALLGAGYAAGLNFAKNIARKVKDVILPAGAMNTNRMANKCLNCNLCINNCPNGILAKADETFSVVHIDYKQGKGYCEFNCNNCSGVCPSGAIKKISLEEKQNTRIAMASISTECVGCGNCVTECPTGAISIVEKKAVVDGSKCIGCGKCATVCKPDAINIFAVNSQSKV